MQSGRTVLIIPGLGNSGPQHWQTLWEAKQSEYRRVQQSDWEHPRRQDWTQNIDAAIWSAESPVVLVAHSMGCIAAVHWSASAGKASRAGRGRTLKSTRFLFLVLLVMTSVSAPPS